MKSITLFFRIILTAYGFAQFAIQVLWLSKWVMPRIIKNKSSSVEKRTQALLQAHKHVNLYIRTLDRLNLIKFHFVGTPSKEPALVVANHPSLIDFIVLLNDYPNAICLFKQQTRKNPVLADFVQLAGYIEGMDGTRAASKNIIEACCQKFHEGHHVVVFPEGTRSKSNTEVGRFRSTVFHAALQQGIPIQPVVIYCKPLFLGKKQAWSDFSQRENHMVIEYLPLIHLSTETQQSKTAQELASSTREVIQKRVSEIHQNPQVLS